MSCSWPLSSRACRDRGRHQYMSRVGIDLPACQPRCQYSHAWRCCGRRRCFPLGALERRTRREQVRRSAYRCVAVAVRNRQNQLRPSSPLRPVATRRVRELTRELWEWFVRAFETARSDVRPKRPPLHNAVCPSGLPRPAPPRCLTRLGPSEIPLARTSSCRGCEDRARRRAARLAT